MELVSLASLILTWSSIPEVSHTLQTRGCLMEVCGFADITGEMVLREGYHKWLNLLQTFLETKFGADVRKTIHSVQFTFNGKIDVDLLVSPYWKDQQELYRFLNRVPKDRQSEYVCMYTIAELAHKANPFQFHSVCLQMASGVLQGCATKGP